MPHQPGDYDFDVISGPSSPPPARPTVFRPPEPRQPPGAAPASSVSAAAPARVVEEV